MPKLSKKQVKHIAQLSRVHLTDKEVAKFASQLSDILDYVDQLSKVNTKGLEPVGNITGLSTVWREDEVKPSFSRDKMLKNAPKKEEGHLKVRAILE